jgi:hypothetical protein
MVGKEILYIIISVASGLFLKHLVTGVDYPAQGHIQYPLSIDGLASFSLRYLSLTHQPEVFKVKDHSHYHIGPKDTNFATRID